MKKILPLLLIVALFVPSFVAAEQPQSWALLVPFNNNTYTMLNIVKIDDSFCVAGVEINSALSGYSYTEKDGCFDLKMEDGIHKAQIVDDKLFYQLVPGGYSVMLSAAKDFDPLYSAADGSFNIEALKISQDFTVNYTSNEKRADPITVPSGVYIAGEDFPAGTYRVELADNSKSGHIKVYESKEKVHEAFSYLHDYDLGSYYGSMAVGKLEILEGYAIEVRNSTLLLKPYEGLK